MIRKLAIVNLVLVSILLLSIIASVWAGKTLAQALNSIPFVARTFGGWYEWVNSQWNQVNIYNPIIVSPVILQVAPNSVATPIGIPTPTNVAGYYPLPSIVINGLPSDGIVLLPDGITPVTLNENLTLAQLTGLQFQPTSNLQSGVSTFTYTISTPYQKDSGAATLIVSAGPVVSHTVCPFSNCSSADLEEAPIIYNDSSTPVALFVPRTGIQPSEVAVIINDLDPQSVTVGSYYQQKYGIPSANAIHVSFPPGNVTTAMSATDFATIYSQVQAQVATNVQAYAISWTFPYSVGLGMSMTSAFTFGGYDPSYAGGTNTCNVLPANPYFNTSSVRPYTDYHIRPAMMLAGSNSQNVMAMINKGAAASHLLPNGDGYFIETSDAIRSGARAANFANTANFWNHANRLNMKFINNISGTAIDAIQNVPDVLFYETGLQNVPYVSSNSYFPGSVADTLTSYSGTLGTANFNLFAWLGAGVTASYGTVTEPCASGAKFPQASVLVSKYFSGNTVVEAYVKSVAMPGEGLFAGDPLARPFGTQGSIKAGNLTIKTSILQPGHAYALYGALAITSSPVLLQSGISVSEQEYVTIANPSGSYLYYELVATN
jgi:uncharacterized protein (TIGR03790 family)